jgi:hypothetical protein
MVEGVGLHRLDDGDVVDDLRGVRQQLGQFSAALSVLGEPELGAQERRIRVDEGGAIPLEQLGGRQLAVELGQLRLVVEELEMARRARLEHEDDALGLGREVRRLGGQRIDHSARRRTGVRGAASQDAAEQRMQRDRAEADAALLEEPAARLVALFLAEEGLMERLAVGHRSVPRLGYCLVIVSSRLSSARAATV